ncbi:Gfo/Idh/MocA family oxidoreductase [Paenibacillus sp. N3/727]|uniref:Gfo/Idh/MocA family protein n=1 Tax=Paenibacillus sp. N3/727 TaxID=2925845 RepID=UPI001F535766|nr:Gfo/Idh/MocA family oxidoreductase [Paenibacillus sp. N3/727]UNK18840.1 Gfo/Idh/MocA family oxidoreductase [Paenibacillus sp. N3/727]
MSNVIKIGMIGLDTSHVLVFTQLLNNPDHEYHVPGGKVIAAYPGGSPDFELSISRVAGFTKQLQEEFGVQILDSPEAVAEVSDAILLESADGRVHLEQFRSIAPYGKPVFIDKPLAVRSDEAREIVELAKQYDIPIMSTSALRYAEGLVQALKASDKSSVTGADIYGPMTIEPTQNGYFWYGIHTVEMLFTILGKDCEQVTTFSNRDHDVIIGEWNDGRIGTVRGNRIGNVKFGATIHRKDECDSVDVYSHPKPYYASLMEQVMTMFQSGKTVLDIEETLQVIRFIEAANESRITRATVKL